MWWSNGRRPDALANNQAQTKEVKEAQLRGIGWARKEKPEMANQRKKS
jgi:hypothetical protein